MTILYPMHMITTGINISYTGARNFSQVHKAVVSANEVLHNDLFYHCISIHKKFDLANVSPSTISELIRNTRLSISVSMYYSLSPLKNYDGYDDTDNPCCIHLNAWKIDRSVASICNTIIHGCIHAVNARYPQYSFGHGDMSSIGKENTAPYWIGALAEQLTSHDNMTTTQLEHDQYEPLAKDIRKYLL